MHLMKFSAEKPRLRKAAKRYRKPYDDSANIKRTDMKRTFFNTKPNGLTDIPTIQRNEVLFFANAHFLFFNFSDTAHCSHLPLPANAQADPKAKAKESNPHRTPTSIF